MFSLIGALNAALNASGTIYQTRQAEALPIWSNNEPTTYGRFKQTRPENLEPYQCQGCKTWQRCAERTILPQHKYPPGEYPSKKSLRGGYAPSRMRPKTKRWREFPRLISQRNGISHPVRNPLLWRGKPAANSTKTDQLLGGFSPNLGAIHIQLQCPDRGRACGVSHPHLKQREEDGKSEAWPPEIETMWTRPWECNPA